MAEELTDQQETAYDQLRIEVREGNSKSYARRIIEWNERNGSEAPAVLQISQGKKSSGNDGSIGKDGGILVQRSGEMREKVPKLPL